MIRAAQFMTSAICAFDAIGFAGAGGTQGYFAAGSALAALILIWWWER